MVRGGGANQRHALPGRKLKPVSNKSGGPLHIVSTVHEISDICLGFLKQTQGGALEIAGVRRDKPASHTFGHDGPPFPAGAGVSMFSLTAFLGNVKRLLYRNSLRAKTEGICEGEAFISHEDLTFLGVHGKVKTVHRRLVIAIAKPDKMSGAARYLSGFLCISKSLRKMKEFL